MNKNLKTRLGLCVVLSLSAIPLILVQRSLARSSVVNPPPRPQEQKPFNQEQALNDLRKAIAGKENTPAEEVFKNIQMLKGMPAGRLLRVMELGYARSLGVNCTHCHAPNGWEKEEKPTKQIARDMNAMMAVINNEQLKKIKNLKGPNSIVNCTTCHRGQTKPALNLPEAPSKE